jgi:hypothetical protein
VFSGFSIGESHGAPVHAPSEKHPVRLGDQLPVELRIFFVGTFNDGVERVLCLCDPALTGSPYQVITPDHANTIKLETLSGIHTANLVDALWINCPCI